MNNIVISNFSSVYPASIFCDQTRFNNQCIILDFDSRNVFFFG